MDLAIAATTFALVIPAELPHKTFISCLVLASRHRPLPVWVGAFSALVLQSGVAVVAGGLIARAWLCLALASTRSPRSQPAKGDYAMNERG